MSVFAGGVVFAGEDSEEEDDLDAGELTLNPTTNETINNNVEGNNKKKDDNGDVVVEKNEDSTSSKLLSSTRSSGSSNNSSGRPADMLATSFIDILMPRLSQTEKKLNELSSSQMKLSGAMSAHTKGVHTAPALHKTHKVMRQVPVYQKKINGLRAEMKAITNMVNRMKKESLAIQLRVQQQLLEAEKKRVQAANAGSQAE